MASKMVGTSDQGYFFRHMGGDLVFVLIVVTVFVVFCLFIVIGFIQAKTGRNFQYFVSFCCRVL